MWTIPNWDKYMIEYYVHVGGDLAHDQIVF